GQIVLSVVEVVGTEVRTRVEQGGVLSDKKGLNKMGGGLSAPALTNKDRADIRGAAELGLDFIAVSFARDGRDIN
ncbi:MAG: pyruvate kinase, partial [Planctomycetales bacterium]|nr:pyruvate kinase [Planctomycetales bacterium]